MYLGLYRTVVAEYERIQTLYGKRKDPNPFCHRSNLRDACVNDGQVKVPACLHGTNRPGFEIDLTSSPPKSFLFSPVPERKKRREEKGELLSIRNS